MEGTLSALSHTPVISLRAIAGTEDLSRSRLMFVCIVISACSYLGRAPWPLGGLARGSCVTSGPAWVVSVPGYLSPTVLRGRRRTDSELLRHLQQVRGRAIGPCR